MKNIKTLTAVITLLQLGIPFAATNAVAGRASVYIRNNAKVCVPYVEGKVDNQACGGSQIDTICKATQALNKGAQQQATGAAVYTAIATTCLVACWYAPAEGACKGVAIAGPMFDMAVENMFFKDAKEFESEAKKGRETLYKVIDPGSGGGMAASMLNPTTIVGTVNSSLAAGIKKGDGNRNAACAVGFISAVMATWKYTNAILLKNNGKKEADKLHGFANETNKNCPTPDNGLNIFNPEHVAGGAQGLTSTTTDLSTGVQANSSLGATFSGTNSNQGDGMMSLPDLLQDLKNDPSNHHQEALETANASLKQVKAPSFEQIAHAIDSEKSPSEIISSLSPEASNLMADINQNQDKIAAAAGITRPQSAIPSADTLYATAAKKPAAKKSADDDLTAMMQGILGQFGGATGTDTSRTPGVAGAQKLSFRAPTTAQTPTAEGVVSDPAMNLFDNVSRRWQFITARFMIEDQVAAGQAPAAALQAFQQAGSSGNITTGFNAYRGTASANAPATSTNGNSTNSTTTLNTQPNR